MVPTGWRLEPQVVESRGGHSALNWTALDNADCKLQTLHCSAHCSVQCELDALSNKRSRVVRWVMMLLEKEGSTRTSTSVGGMPRDAPLSQSKYRVMPSLRPMLGATQPEKVPRKISL